MDLEFRNPKPHTPVWWLDRLSQKLNDRNREIGLYNDYYEGKHKLAFATPKYKEVFGNTFAEFSDNWCSVAVDAVNERMAVVGFRYGDDPKSDKEAWKIWQNNNLDAMSQMGQLEGLIKCESYALVWPGKDGEPVITIEDPTEVIVEFAAGNRTERAAALKQFVNDDGYVWATLYLPDGLYKFKSTKPHDNFAGLGQKITWQQREIEGEHWPLSNPSAPAVPVVPLMNNARLLSGGVSELKDLIPLQDGINKTISDMLLTSEFGAAPQRWGIGFEPPKDDQGNVLPMAQQLLNRMWVSESKDTQFGQFPQASMQPYVDATTMLVTHFASRSRTPPHYFYLNGQFPSGEAVKSAETGLVAKAVRKMLVLGEGYEETMRLCFVIKGNKKRSQERQVETIWKDPETRTEGEHIDALVKKRALGVPIQQLWEDANYSPTQIERFKQLLDEEKDWNLPVTVGATAANNQIASGASPSAFNTKTDQGLPEQ